MKLSLSCLMLCLCTMSVQAADWPMWRYDPGRSASSPQKLPGDLHLHWMREYPPEQPAWPEQEKMQFDICYEPIVVGQTLFMNSGRHDCIRAIDTRTGERKWTFFAEGPIRFAPLAWKDKLYFSSDDGYLYCIQQEDAKLNWKFRGGPSDRKILGNERIISTWPARGAPVLKDGTVYFAASIWPFMGIFIHAVDAQTGKAIWTNDGDGSLYLKQPHNTDSFASIAPQGSLVISGNYLLLPGGRSVPACFDRRTGKFLRYQLAENGKKGGGSEVAALGGVFFNGGAVFDIANEKYQGEFSRIVAFTPKQVFGYVNGMVRMVDPQPEKNPPPEQDKDKKTSSSKSSRWPVKELAAVKTRSIETLIKAGNRLFAGGDGFILAIDLDLVQNQMSVAWELPVKGNVVRLIAADDRLFAATREGALYGFGAERREAVKHVRPPVIRDPKDIWTGKTQQLLKAAQVKDGYCIVFGLGSNQLINELLKQTQLRLLVLENDVDKTHEARRTYTALDQYGSRITIYHGQPETFEFPPYLASLIVSEDSSYIPDAPWSEIYQSLRPYGGTIALFPGPKQKDFAEIVKARPEAFVNADVSHGPVVTLVKRVGALPGSANWTHEHADASNTRFSKDKLVKAPLGILWFGGPSHDGILPRHGHGPQPQVVDGRMFIEGIDLLRAIDIYTGRLLWEAKLPGVGQFYNNSAHQPGANSSGSNYISTSEGIYVAYQDQCLKLDPANGKRIAAYPMPQFPGRRLWGYINIVDDYLIGGADPLLDPKALPPKNKGTEVVEAPKAKALDKVLKLVKSGGDNLSSSRHLFVMDRHTGKTLWTISAKHGFRHNGTCAGNGKLYTIDRLSGDQLLKFTSKDIVPEPAALFAFDLKTGQPVWNTDADVFGTWLSYSAEHDCLVEAGRVTRDALKDEPMGMRVYQASNGKVLWHQKKYAGPALLFQDAVLQGNEACNIFTGLPKLRPDPVTGLPVPWKWVRNYGCNTPAGSEHLLTFRSGAAGYYDLSGDGGTGNFGGFRSSCTNNLIVAGGILTVPEYTRTCTCAYQNQTSVALIHLPETEMWTSFGSKEAKGPVKRLGLNLGAAGDRRAPDGTLWTDYPSIAGVSPSVPVQTKADKMELLRRHSSAFSGPYNWVTSSGIQGLDEISINLGKTADPRKFTVRLFFAEPDAEVTAGERVFHVDVQGKRVVSDLDVFRASGGSLKSFVQEVKGVVVEEMLVIRLTKTEPSVERTLLCGIEVVEEK